MGVPPYVEILDPLLRILADAPHGLAARDAQDEVADRLKLTSDDRLLRVANGTQLLFRHRTNWAHDRLKRALLSSTPRRAIWMLTEKGLDFVRSHPEPLARPGLRDLAKVGRDARMVAVVHPGEQDIGSARV